MVRTLSFQCRGPGVQSLVGELRSHKPLLVAKKKKKKLKKKGREVSERCPIPLEPVGKPFSFMKLPPSDSQLRMRMDDIGLSDQGISLEFLLTVLMSSLECR